MAQEQQGSLLRAQPVKAPPAPPNRKEAAGARFPWMTLLWFAYLTFHTVLSIRRCNGDRADIALFVFMYIDLVLLFVCLRWYERAAPDSATRGRLRVAVWLLITLLNMVVSYMAAAIMPVAHKVLIWAMTCASALGGFYIMFLYGGPKVDLPSVSAS